MKNILVMQLYRYGDVLQSTPALASLRRAAPDARIHVMVRKAFAEVLRGNPDVDEVVEWDADVLAQGPSDAASCLERMAALREFIGPLQAKQFDAVYNLSNDMPSALLISLLRPREVAGLVFCPDRQYRVRNDWLRYLFIATNVRSLNTINLVDVFAAACGGADRLAPRLAVNPDDEQSAERFLAGLKGTREPIGLQIGASKPAKRWPAARFGELARRLAQEGHPLLFFGAQNERIEVAAILRDWPESLAAARNLAGETSFAQLASLVKRCRLLISNDTSTIHVAAAVGTPCLALTFGSASGWDTGPYGEGHFILEPRAACFPCGWLDRCTTLGCRDLLSVDAVQAAVACARSGGRELAPVLRGGDVVLHRSRWMPDGLLGLEPLTQPPLTLRDLLRRMVRSYFVSRRLRSEGSAPSEAWRPWRDEMLLAYRVDDPKALLTAVASAAADLATLKRLADLGVQAANTVLQRSEPAGATPESRAHLGEAVARLERRIFAAEENEVLRFLVAAFRHSLLDMDTLPPRQKAALHRWNYQSLSEGCAFLHEALGEFARSLSGAGRPAAEAPPAHDVQRLLALAEGRP